MAFEVKQEGREEKNSEREVPMLGGKKKNHLYVERPNTDELF